MPDKTRTLNLQYRLPEPPPRPHVGDVQKLTIVINGHQNPIFKFDQGQEVRIGRHIGTLIRWNNLDLSVYDGDQRTVSRRHCQITFMATGYGIEDMRSRNGTWLNGVRLLPEKSTPLSNRDYVQVGGIGFWVYLPIVSPTPKEDEG